VNDQADPHEPLVSDLQALFARLDPLPPLVTQAAKAALGWRRIDAELAELLADSTLEVELAGARGAGTPVRSVSFRAGELTIDLEIAVADTGLTLLGLLTPASTARIEIQATDGSIVASAESDRLGRFRTQLAAGAAIRLRLALAETVPIETSWITV
jgi:hypothetical protein